LRYVYVIYFMANQLNYLFCCRFIKIKFKYNSCA
jgi:hypothetical protein